LQIDLVLARCYPLLFAQAEDEIVRLYVKRTGEGCFRLTKPSESKARLPEAAASMGQLVLQVAQTEAAQLIDFSYNKHREHGYGVQIMETYAEDDEVAGASEDDLTVQDLILHVAVGKLTEHDSNALEPAIVDVRERGLCPTQVLGDSHYGSDDLVRRITAQGINLVSPAMPPKGYKQGQLTLEQFELDESGAITACPQGYAPAWSSVSKTKIEVRFDLEICQDCPLRQQCPGYLHLESGKRWQYTPKRVATRA
jgi:hypothetical protein